MGHMGTIRAVREDAAPPALARVTASAARAEAAQARDRKRGYRMNGKMVALAYGAELVIASASLAGAVAFAHAYGHGDPWTISTMMLAPISYAVIEICRVPLAFAVRTQASAVMRIAALVGVVGAAGVTVKSMSQLGEIMFRPRLVEVMHARERLDHARAVEAALDKRIADADALVAERAEEASQASRQLAVTTEKLGGLPGQSCLPTTGTDRAGHAWRSVRCVADPRVATLSDGVADAARVRDAARAPLAEARAARALLDRGTVESARIAGQAAYHDAVMNSQLHSFTAMVFGRDPTEVSDAEVHSFLRLFVFLPAICAAFAATLVAMAAVQKLKLEVDGTRDTTLDEDGADFILGPFAQEVVAAATEAATETLRASMEPSAPPSRPVVVARSF